MFSNSFQYLVKKGPVSKVLTLVIFSFFIGSFAMASFSGAAKVYNSRMESSKKYRKMVIELSAAKLYFSAIPWMKEYLISSKNKLDSQLEGAFENIITHTGSKQFELLPLKYLVRSKSNSLMFVIAKKLYKEGKLSEAISFAKKVLIHLSLFCNIACN